MEKEDALEQFIRSHREELDALKAPSRVWRAKNQGQGSHVHPLWKWSAVAASALLLMAMGYILGLRTVPGQSIAGWQEFEEAEQYYQARINTRMEKIKTLPVSDEVLGDIQALDEVYAQLREQLLHDPHARAEVLLAAMIKHQKQKLDIMDDILDRVEKYKSNETNKQHEM